MDAKPMLEFDGWLMRRSSDESWITVAQHSVTERDGWEEDLFMTSVLAPTNASKVLLANSQWLASNDFGKSDVGSGGDCVEVQTKYVDKNRDVRIEPFTFLRLWHGTWADIFELIQNFILFYNLHFDAVGNRYVAVNDAGETTDVVRIGNVEQHKKVEIRTKFLRNYLACRDRVLVRQHDHQMRADRELAELGIKPYSERRLAGSDHVFELTVADSGLTGKGPAIGLLNGKDMVLPSDKCQDLLGFPKGSCEFIVGVDDHDVNIMEPCVDAGSDIFLTPVYFSCDVLKKYHNDPIKYKIEHGAVSCGAYWTVRMNQVADVVMVFLGDLSSLPANEQPHWQEYNMRPKNVTHEHRVELIGDGTPNAGHAADNKIPEGEDGYNEFKETFSVKVKEDKGQKDKDKGDIRMAVVRTVAAFANTDGGRLFIGVNDDGKPVGLRKDLEQYHNSKDELQLAIRDFVLKQLRVQVNMKFDFSGDDYLVISVDKHRHSFVYIGDEVIIRDGNRSRTLPPRETAEYQKEYRLT